MCRSRQSKTVMGQQRHAVQQNNNDASYFPGNVTNFLKSTVANGILVLTPAEMPISNPNAPIQSSTIASSSIALDTIVPDAIPEHKLSRTPLSYNNGSTPVKVITTTALRAAVTTNPMEPLARMPAIIATDTSINVAANGHITPPANSIISKLDRVSAAEAFSAIDRIEMTASASIITQRYRDASSILVHIFLPFFSLIFVSRMDW